VRGIDLRDLFTGRMSWRRFAVLLTGLPVDSEFKTALRNATDLDDLPEPEPGIYGPWPQTDMLLARGLDMFAHWMWANSDPDHRPAQPPPPYPRPGVVEGNVHAISEEALAYLEYKREHRGADPPADWKPVLTAP
jgi:hypothetical protein